MTKDKNKKPSANGLMSGKQSRKEALRKYVDANFAPANFSERLIVRVRCFLQKI